MKGKQQLVDLSRLYSLLEVVYERYNRREFVSPDPLEFVYRYETPEDREVVALIASCLAYGRVAQILRSVETVLGVLGDSPAAFLKRISPEKLVAPLRSFRHRFTSGEDTARLLGGIGSILRKWGSLEGFLDSNLQGTSHVLEGIALFAEGIREAGKLSSSFLLASPRDGSACKRLFLFLKWMVRSDDVDPGGWSVLSPKDLIVPLDVHMFRICSALGFTRRATADLRTARESTEAFKRILPEDPVKYDFVLTRFGIRSELDKREFIDYCLRGETQ